jgi:hypothetical protein
VGPRVGLDMATKRKHLPVLGTDDQLSSSEVLKWCVPPRGLQKVKVLTQPCRKLSMNPNLSSSTVCYELVY